MTDYCIACRFFHAGTNPIPNAFFSDPKAAAPPRSECRRRAPGSHGIGWPYVMASDWCGEFEAAVEGGLCAALSAHENLPSQEEKPSGSEVRQVD